MATVTGYTAERMKQIEDTTVIDGEVQGSNLILFQRNGTNIDAGSVRGPKGDTGSPGPVLPAGTILQWAGSAAPPTGFKLCDGGALSRTTYPLLFTAIGATYGAGDGSTTFTLPNFKGRVPVGIDNTQVEFSTQGKTGGSKTHTLSGNEMPSHNHLNPDHNHSFTAYDYSFGDAPQGGGGTAAWGSTITSARGSQLGMNSGAAWSSSAGNGVAHNNLQPYITIAYIISTGGE